MLNVAEFFSGIGGWRCAVDRAFSGIPTRVVGAFDINTVANDVYEANFHFKPSSVRFNWKENYTDSFLLFLLISFKKYI